MEDKRSSLLGNILSSIAQVYAAHIISNTFSKLSHLKRELISSIIAALFSAFLLMTGWIVINWTLFAYLLMNKFNYLEAGVTIAGINFLLSAIIFLCIMRKAKNN
jgi:hypothetical protein